MRTITTRFPTALCRKLGLKPGSRVTLERRTLDGEAVWVIRGPAPDWSWVGAARHYATGKSNRWTDVKRSIARGWAGGPRS